jgi:L-ascorbate metabolism protein UlaG (beta-lactamase superfamily)
MALLVVMFVAAGCVPQVGPGATGVVERGIGSDAPIEFTYLGTGGWIMRRGGDVVLGAPLFSNPSFLGVGLTAIEADTAAIDRAMAPHDVADAGVILVGHSHYDHLMDVPRVAERYAPSARIVGTRTAKNLLGHWSGLMDRVDLSEDHVADQESVGSWIEYGPGVRVLPLRSDHAPHFDGLELYAGTAERPLDEPPRTAAEWLGGETFAFLVDFLDPSGAVAFRVYYQDAVTAPPYGFAPDALIAEHAVDVAILVPATFDQVEWHPEAFVENLKPERILLGHWENFFIPIEDKTRSIMMADIEHFEARLRRVFDGEFWRPEIGTVFRFGTSPG